MTTQTGFLLSFLKYGDYDAVLHCFTKENGYQSFFMKGIFSAKNKKKSYLQPLNELNFTFSKTPRPGKMPLISQMDMVETPDFYQDVKCNAIVFFIADFLNSNLREEGFSEDLYQEILFFLNELENKNYACHLIFLFTFLEFIGFMPLLGNGIFLNPEKGIFQSEIAHALFSTNISTLWKKLIEAENPYSVKISAALRKEFLDSLFVYYHFHSSGFRTPKSLEIVQQIFED